MEEFVRRLLATRWRLHDATITVLRGAGICSETWLVADGSQRWVAKASLVASSSSAVGFEFGLRVAEKLGDAGFRAGPPVRTVDGECVADLDGWQLALLAFEDGDPFRVTDLAAATRVGAHFGLLHGQLRRISGGAETWDPAADLIGRPYLALRPGLEELATNVVDTARAATVGFEIGLIHGDLDADEILLAPDGAIAVVDWGSIQVAPQILDLLTFHDEEGFSSLVDGYVSVRPEAEAELEALPELERLQWLRQTAFWGDRLLQPARRPEPPVELESAPAYGRAAVAAHSSSRVAEGDSCRIPVIPTARAASTFSTRSSTKTQSVRVQRSRLAARRKIAGSGFSKPTSAEITMSSANR